MQPTCTHSGCDRPKKTRHRLCQFHVSEYGRLGISSLRSNEQRFATKYVARDTGCWEWQGYVDADGYGWFQFEGKWTTAHRAAHRMFLGPVPDDWEVDHLCRNRACVNPAHIEAVTHDENMRRQGEAVAHCPRGHRYTDQTTRRNARGNRSCVVCARAKKPCPLCGVLRRDIGSHLRHMHEGKRVTSSG